MKRVAKVLLMRYFAQIKVNNGREFGGATISKKITFGFLCVPPDNLAEKKKQQEDGHFRVDTNPFSLPHTHTNRNKGSTFLIGKSNLR